MCIITGKLRVDSSPIELPQVIEAATDSMRPALASKAITFNFTADPETRAVLGDFDRLLQVIWNLLSNAVKFTPPGGHDELR